MTDKFQDKSQVIEAELTPRDEEFLKEINQQILNFLEKDEEILEFDPMNSYQRRLAVSYTHLTLPTTYHV